MRDLIGTGLGFPLRTGRGGGIELVGEDDDVREAMLLILCTAPGERPMRPEFGCGIHEHVFNPADGRTIALLEHEIRLALDRWEPRAEVQDVSFELGRAGAGELRVEIAYRLRDTSDLRLLVFPFYLVPGEEA